MDDPADCTAECNTRGLKLQQETMDPVASHLWGGLWHRPCRHSRVFQAARSGGMTMSEMDTPRGIIPARFCQP